MPKVNHVAILKTVVPRMPFELSWTAAGCAQHLPRRGTPRRALRLPGLSYGGPSLHEARIWPVVENRLKWVFHCTPGEFRTGTFISAYRLRAHVCVDQFKT